MRRDGRKRRRCAVTALVVICALQSVVIAMIWIRSAANSRRAYAAWRCGFRSALLAMRAGLTRAPRENVVGVGDVEACIDACLREIDPGCCDRHAGELDAAKKKAGLP